MTQSNLTYLLSFPRYWVRYQRNKLVLWQNQHNFRIPWSFYINVQNFNCLIISVIYLWIFSRKLKFSHNRKIKSPIHQAVTIVIPDTSYKTQHISISNRFWDIRNLCRLCLYFNTKKKNFSGIQFKNIMNIHFRVFMVVYIQLCKSYWLINKKYFKNTLLVDNKLPALTSSVWLREHLGRGINMKRD